MDELADILDWIEKNLDSQPDRPEHDFGFTTLDSNDPRCHDIILD